MAGSEHAAAEPRRDIAASPAPGLRAFSWGGVPMEAARRIESRFNCSTHRQLEAGQNARFVKVVAFVEIGIVALEAL